MRVKSENAALCLAQEVSILPENVSKVVLYRCPRNLLDLQFHVLQRKNENWDFTLSRIWTLLCPRKEPETEVSSSDILFINSALTSDVFEVGMMSSRLLRSATDTIREDSRTC